MFKLQLGTVWDKVPQQFFPLLTVVCFSVVANIKYWFKCRTEWHLCCARWSLSSQKKWLEYLVLFISASLLEINFQLSPLKCHYCFPQRPFSHFRRMPIFWVVKDVELNPKCKFPPLPLELNNNNLLCNSIHWSRFGEDWNITIP